MSTPNFKTMRNFPLYVKDDVRIKVCPECGVISECPADICSSCGADLSKVESEYDEYFNQLAFHDIQEDCFKLEKEELKFHGLEVTGGYYRGMQLLVTVKHNPSWMSNAETMDTFGMYRSKAILAYEREQRKIRRAMSKIAHDHGMIRLRCFGVFSNGEAYYEEIPFEQDKRKIAVLAY